MKNCKWIKLLLVALVIASGFLIEATPESPAPVITPAPNPSPVPTGMWEV